ncbi:MAG: glycerate kinase [Oscillospiraceae bacterium]|nr:glycerate kinase [Oscillospiraceae bacterium]
MKKIILAPDSYKGTLDAVGASEAMRAGITEIFPDCRVVSLPVADGGEGTVACFLRAMEGQQVRVSVTGPFPGERVEAVYGLLGSCAVIEMAACAGLPLAEGRLDPLRTTTYGVGELIAHALKAGAKEILLGLGGSCTNDCGAGMAAALGTVFYDRKGASFLPVGGTLDRVERYDDSRTRALLEGVSVTAMCDITNPLYGPEGAAYVFAPQKGADGECVRKLDHNLQKMENVIRQQTGLLVQSMAGAGAAGGMGAGVAAFLGGRLAPGIDEVLRLTDYEGHLAGADLVITGEGRFDSQSLEGKVASGLGRRAKAAGVPLVVLAGALGEELDWARAEGLGISAAFSINRAPEPFETARYRTAENLRRSVRELMRLIRRLEGN